MPNIRLRPRQAAIFRPEIPSKPVTTRTLTIAGFKIRGFDSHPRYGEYRCTRYDIFDAEIPYIVAIFDNSPTKEEILVARRFAVRQGHIFVAVSNEASAESLGWRDFLERLGGAVPTWRALGPSFPEVLRQSARDRVPEGVSGEAWQIFEDATADGLEFLFGQRVLRLGGHKRGLNLSDMLTQTPDGSVLLIDTKASRKKFSIGKPGLRPLLEYVKEQRTHQQGSCDISSVIVVAGGFEQSSARLGDLSGDFLSDSKIPLGFLGVNDLVRMIEEMKRDPILRGSLRWSQIFCRGGVVSFRLFRDELKRTRECRYGLVKGR